MLVFSSGLMVLLHRRSKTGGFRCALPEGVGSLEWDYLRLNLLLENPRWITQSRFKAVSTAGVSFCGCCGCREGVYGRCWGLSEALQRGSGGGVVPAQRCWVGGLWTAGTLFSMEPRDRGRRRSYRWSCCPEPGSESRFGIPVQNLGGAWGSGLVGRDPPGSLTIRVVHSFFGSWALEFQPRNRRRPEEKYFKYTRGIIGKKFLFFPKRLLRYSNHSFVSPCSNYIVYVRSLFWNGFLSNNTP